jgi:hypothetical protein
MIEIAAGFPDDVAPYVCHGRLTRGDYELVLQDVEARLKRHHTLRMYCEVGADYLGAKFDGVWQHWKSSFASWFRWKRGALVTDVTWLAWATRLSGLVIPGQWRVFGLAEAGEARRWITGG